MNVIVQYKGNYKPLIITAVTVKDTGKNVVELYNEQGEMFQWLMVWNDNVNVESEVVKHYNTKFAVMDILKAIHNKFKVTGRVDSYDVDHVKTMLSNWIVKPTIKKQFEYIDKHLNVGNAFGAYNELLNIKSCIDYSVPCTNDTVFYLLEKY